MDAQYFGQVSKTQAGFSSRVRFDRNRTMGTEEIPASKKDFRTSASRLKYERERRGWTQSEVAERIDTTQVNISRWEKSITAPGPYYRQKIGVLFRKTLTELCFL